MLDGLDAHLLKQQLDARSVISGWGIASLRYMRHGEQPPPPLSVAPSSLFLCLSLRVWLTECGGRGEVTHYQCREAFSKKLNAAQQG